MALRRLPIHRALWRPHLIAGGERDLMLGLIVFSVGLPVTTQTIFSVVVGVSLGVFGTAMLRWLAKIDPQFLKVYRRARAYRAYYPPRSRPARVDDRIRKQL
ncbi:conjugal transfer protein TrbD [Acidocella aminolytica]|uniref:Conjugal transfer protein TrbD n=2 Tax=Pseudomonadota TaxID=1224 RepID=A0A0D6PHQ7_9PROT|nr:conjugal transfer protein TrbD [Acidocella aminolytica]MDD2861988.1 conjugal transfer protein TrbD [Acidiphilium sp.]GAN80369.1 conjugal transfer protein TrbD [Acidocella aminolytica 101 = DSM 11237]GBQ33710.1 conjugal transfer protein TrbD [Acidocella aminolytica 101 = DSM 11237]SHF60425.1 type IV secretion system protein VirB3 [Acidocella aminolytica 101 = DSM 11237]